jgi:hypothetical protein
VKWNVAPRPPSPLAQIRPSCDSTIDLLIARPGLVIAIEIGNRTVQANPLQIDDHESDVVGLSRS